MCPDTGLVALNVHCKKPRTFSCQPHRQITLPVTYAKQCTSVDNGCYLQSGVRKMRASAIVEYEDARTTFFMGSSEAIVTCTDEVEETTEPVHE